ncbi:MAG: EAL domain-containing protein [Sphingomonadales bacterium]
MQNVIQPGARRPRPFGPRTLWRRLDPRVRLVIFPFLLALLFGAIEFGEPLEDIYRGARNLVRLQASSGSVVVVGVDEKTGAALGGFNFSRTLDVRAVENLFSVGARRVMFDRTYAFKTDPASDAAFAQLIARYGRRVVIGAASPINPTTLKPVQVLPLPIFRKAGSMVSLNGRQTPFALSAKLTFGDTIGGIFMPSMSSALAEQPVVIPGAYRPDWSIDTRTIPTLSFVDVLENRFEQSIVRGRDVIVGPTATSLGDIRQIVFQGFMPGVYLHVVGAESLRRGHPVDLGWLPPFLFSAAFSFWFTSAATRRRFWIATSAGMLAFFAMPLLLDSFLISIDVMPAVFLQLVVSWRARSLMALNMARRMNIRSGLPNLAALEAVGSHSSDTLIVMKVRNLSRVVASFDNNVEAEIVGELCRRLAIDPEAGTIYHVEDNLCWLTPEPMQRTLSDHLEGLHRLVTQTVMIGDRAVDLSVSFGVDADVERNIGSRVGSASLCADEAGRANDVWKFFDPERRHQAAWQLALMSRLDLALDNGEIYVVFQPKVSLPSMTIDSAEALVRWQHPTRGLIGPDEFIPAAEEHQRIGRLTSFVLDRAMIVAREARERGHNLSVAVNVASQLIGDAGFSETVLSALHRHDIAPENLILEVTESGHLTAATDRNFISRAYLDRGIKISLDDFGAGNATLERLHVLHPDEVKIDRQFVQGIDQDPGKREIVMATIAMTHALGGRVVAEGVERQEELNFLLGANCDAVQGYLLGKPMASTLLLDAIDDSKPSRRRLTNSVDLR